MNILRPVLARFTIICLAFHAPGLLEVRNCSVGQDTTIRFSCWSQLFYRLFFSMDGLSQDSDSHLC